LRVYDDESDLRRLSRVEKLAGMDKLMPSWADMDQSGRTHPMQPNDMIRLFNDRSGRFETVSKNLKTSFRLNKKYARLRQRSQSHQGTLGPKRSEVLYNSLSATTEIAEFVRDQLVKAGLRFRSSRSLKRDNQLKPFCSRSGMLDVKSFL